MDLYLLRHADAQPAGAAGDRDRVLTAEGRDAARATALALRALGASPALLASSPLARARQTIEIAGRTLAPALEPELCSALAPGGDFAHLVAWLRARETGDTVLCGHMPDLAECAGRFVAGGSPGLAVTLKKAAVCCLSFAGSARAGAGTLEWLLQPRQIRLMAAAARG